ncbi:MAG: D-alanyl-D-alanine carboxypeptidase/D-alanyl-D-alanine-endopeptidase [Nocardioides sp.]|uniref:D-alanyl-D-alanine carboxypeptidase/D-alanyl-D-alanine endopeptidase n=1 Tax=Nocardioides sp. TaxID=35761 RepID=UPI003F0DCD1F
MLAVLLLLAGAVAAHRFQLGPSHLPWLAADPATQPEQVAPPAGLELPAASTPSPVAAAAPAAGALDAAAVRTALRRAVKDDAFGRRIAVGVATLDGEAWSTGPDAFTPASTTKVLTAVAALEVLGPDHRFTTTVASGATDGEIVLVGGGDPYLSESATPAQEVATTYPQRADLATLAVQVRAALLEQGAEGAGQVKVRLRYDDSLFTGPGASSHWRPDYVPDDVVAPIGALMLDGGREAGGYGRADDPAAATAAAFARQLRAAGVTVVGKPRPGRAGAEQLASVQGAPLADVVETVVARSDNEGAELLGHHVGLAVDGEGSFEAGARATLATLRGLGVDVAGTELYDGSGLSRDNLIGTATLVDTLQVSAAATHPGLRAAWTGMPVAGFTGSLYDRFAASPSGQGLVRAKTGTLTGVHSLAGTVLDADGQVLVFVAAADRVDPSRALDAEAGLDALATALAGCSCTRTG